MESCIRTRPRPTCALCDSPGERLYSGLKDRLFGAPGEWSVSRCLNADCGLLWLDPFPVEDDLGKAYQTYYTHGGGKQHKSLGRRILVSGLAVLVKLITFLCGLARQKRNVANMHLDGMPPGRLLEIGCGDGAFLYKMKERGWIVEGLDFDGDAVRAAVSNYGVQARTERLEDMDYASESFDAITMHHVIEHVFDPVGLLREIHRLLKPGGRLVAVTPNVNSWGHERFRENWRGLEPPRHVRIFSRHALASATAAAGFQQSWVYSTAANAWNIFVSSFALDGATKLVNSSEPPGTLIILRALAMQCREAWLNLGGRDNGEECVLVARK